MTLPAPTPLVAGAGGGGGLTAESDPTIWYDEGADTYFVRTVEYDDAGAVTGVSDVTAAGGAYVVVGPIRPAAAALVGGPNATLTLTRVQNTTFNSSAGNLATHYIVIADAVTVDAVSVPANTGHTFEVPGRTVPAIAFVADLTGDVLVIEEAA